MRTSNIAPGSGPEALEDLMANKPFDALNAEERAYALEHVDSPEEYESMRGFLLQVTDLDAGPLKARPQTKEDLLALFVKEEKAGATVWLNTLWSALWVPKQSFTRQPAFAVALGAVALLVVSVMLFPSTETNLDLAEAHTEAPSESSAPSTSTETTPSEESKPSIQENEQASPPPESTPETPSTVVTESLQEDVDEEKYFSVEETDNFGLADIPATDQAPVVASGNAEVSGDALALEENKDFDVDQKTVESLGDPLAREREADYRSDEVVTEAKVIASEDKAELQQFNYADTSLDSTAQPMVISGADMSLSNTFDATANDIQLLEVESVAMSASAPSQEMGTRGLEVSFVPSPVVGQPVAPYKDLFDLLYTAW